MGSCFSQSQSPRTDPHSQFSPHSAVSDHLPRTWSPSPMQQDLPPQTQEVESIPLHQWCQLELGLCHHAAVQPLDSMEIACLHALCGVLGVKANKIHGQDAQNA